MVLTAEFSEECISSLILDLYQCKNFTNFNDNFRDDWFHTVGWSENKDSKKANYCRSYVLQLVQRVAADIRNKGIASENMDSKIGLQAVVVPQSVDEVEKACLNSGASQSAAERVLMAVENCNEDVTLWTEECLRPTIRVVKVKVGIDDGS